MLCCKPARPVLDAIDRSAIAVDVASQDGLAVRSASELARLIRGGEVSAKEVVESHIRRIKEVDDRLNAVVFRRFDQALAEAAAADEARARGDSIGPPHGVPVTIKDQFLVTGMPTTFGLPGRASHRANADGPLVGRLRRAGAIVLGKTNVSQLLFYHESDNPLYGRTNNPWNLDRTPGGSSGGEAAIVAAGGSALGLGSDLGGSIRVPAHFCGIAGLKPTSGRLTLLDTPAGIFFAQNVIVYQPGTLARTVDDLALAMSVLAAPGQEDFDPTIEGRTWPDSTVLEVAALRVGLYEDDGWFRPSPAVRRAVRDTGVVLEACGARVEPFRPPDVGEALRLFIAVLSADGLQTFHKALRGQPVDPRLKAFLAVSKIPRPIRPVVAAAMIAAGRPHAGLAVRAGGPWGEHRLRALAGEVEGYRARFLASLDAARLDVLVCPPHALPALTHGTGDDLTAITAGSYATLFNVLGLPAGVMPATHVRAGEESDRVSSRNVPNQLALGVERGSVGLPVGVQVVARPWREDVVLSVMAAVEGACRSEADYPVLAPL